MPRYVRPVAWTLFGLLAFAALAWLGIRYVDMGPSPIERAWQIAREITPR